MSDVNTDGGDETATLIRESGGEAVFVKADISQPGDVKLLINRAREVYGSLDCACNNAGVEGRVAPLSEQALENYDTVMSVNARGVFLCLKAEIGQMLNTGGGAIVNVASVAGIIGFPGRLSPYVASKHAINGLAKNAALEYGKQGIRVNAVCPGGIDTRMLDSVVAQTSGGARTTRKLMDPLHPIGRIGKPEELAELIVWLCSPLASFVTGAIVPVDGAYVAQSDQ